MLATPLCQVINTRWVIPQSKLWSKEAGAQHLLSHSLLVRYTSIHHPVSVRGRSMFSHSHKQPCFQEVLLHLPLLLYIQPMQYLPMQLILCLATKQVTTLIQGLQTSKQQWEDIFGLHQQLVGFKAAQPCQQGRITTSQLIHLGPPLQLPDPTRTCQETLSVQLVLGLVACLSQMIDVLLALQL